MDLLSDLDEVIEKIKGAKPVPLSASAMINKQEILEVLEGIKANAPEELKQARWMMRDRDELLNESQKQATRLVEEARAERDRLIAKTEIVAAANREADKIIEEAKARAREIRMEAEDYVDAKLANFEVILQKTMAAVGKGRESLRGRLDLQQKQAAAEAAESSQQPDQPSETGNVRLRRK